MKLLITLLILFLNKITFQTLVPINFSATSFSDLQVQFSSFDDLSYDQTLEYQINIKCDSATDQLYLNSITNLGVMSNVKKLSVEITNSALFFDATPIVDLINMLPDLEDITLNLTNTQQVNLQWLNGIFQQNQYTYNIKDFNLYVLNNNIQHLSHINQIVIYGNVQNILLHLMFNQINSFDPIVFDFISSNQKLISFTLLITCQSQHIFNNMKIKSDSLYHLVLYSSQCFSFINNPYLLTELSQLYIVSYVFYYSNEYQDIVDLIQLLETTNSSNFLQLNIYFSESLLGGLDLNDPMFLDMFKGDFITNKFFKQFNFFMVDTYTQDRSMVGQIFKYLKNVELLQVIFQSQNQNSIIPNQIFGNGFQQLSYQVYCETQNILCVNTVYNAPQIVPNHLNLTYVHFYFEGLSNFGTNSQILVNLLVPLEHTHLQYLIISCYDFYSNDIPISGLNLQLNISTLVLSFRFTPNLSNYQYLQNIMGILDKNALQSFQFYKQNFTIPSSIALDISTLPIALDGFNNIQSFLFIMDAETTPYQYYIDINHFKGIFDDKNESMKIVKITLKFLNFLDQNNTVWQDILFPIVYYGKTNLTYLEITTYQSSSFTLLQYENLHVNGDYLAVSGNGSPALSNYVQAAYFVEPSSLYNCFSYNCHSCDNQSTCLICRYSSTVERELPGCNCPTGYYSSNILQDYDCYQCQAVCQTCSDQFTCNSCVNNLIMNIHNMCDCNPGQFLEQNNLGQYFCQNCDPKCSTCDNNYECLTCLDINYFPPNCVCQKGQIEKIISNKMICQPCEDQCAACENSAENCTECLDGETVLPLCLCQPGYYIDYNIGKCQKCSEICATCYESSQNCLTCINGALKNKVTNLCEKCESLAQTYLEYLELCKEFIAIFYILFVI